MGQQENIRPFLKRLDIYCCTSNFESSPLSVWEAMSMSKAIISTNVGDIPKYIKSGYSGEILKVNDPEISSKFSNKLNALIQDKNKIYRYGLNAREIAVNMLDLELCANRHKKAYYS